MTRNRGALTALAVAFVAAAAMTADAPAADKPDYKGMTANVLQQINGGAKTTGDKTENFLDTITTLVEQAKAEGRGDAYVSDLISEAAAEGVVEVPDALRTPSGEVDTATLLNAIVARATSKKTDYKKALATEAGKRTPAPTRTAAAEPAAAEPAAAVTAKAPAAAVTSEAPAAAVTAKAPAAAAPSEVSVAAAPSAAPVATATKPAEKNQVFHVVERGQSLAAIAVIYYSDALAYPRILDANRDQIRNANLIQVGQRLVIPQ